LRSGEGRKVAACGGDDADSSSRCGVVFWNGEDHVRADAKLEIDLSSSPPIRAPALRLRLGVGPPAPLAATAVEDHLDIPVVSEPLQEIVVEARFVAGNEEQVSSHRPFYCLSALHVAGHFFLTKSWGEHLECHS
jgi:hypothetical protein